MQWWAQIRAFFLLCKLNMWCFTEKSTLFVLAVTFSKFLVLSYIRICCNNMRHIQKVRTNSKQKPCKWCVHFLWCSVVFSMSRGNNMYGIVQHHIFPPFSVVAKDERKKWSKVQSVIWHLNGKNVRLADIHRQIAEMCGKGAMSDGKKCEKMVLVVQRRQD
jgi:hypothetical protein